MNGLLKLHKDFPIAGLIPFRYLLYTALLSDIAVFEETEGEEETRWAIFNHEGGDVYDFFDEWTSADTDKDEVYKALNELADEGLIFFDDDERIYVGEFRGKKLFPFEQKSSLYDQAVELLDKRLHNYGNSRSAKDKSRARYIRDCIDSLPSVDKMGPGNFTDLHGYLYEIFTGGEIYVIRNKTEYYQTNNMLKAYDRHTVFALIVEGTLNYDKYRKKGVPTITNVAMIKDEVMRSLTSSGGSKEYMRDKRSALSDDTDF